MAPHFLLATGELDRPPAPVGSPVFPARGRPTSGASTADRRSGPRDQLLASVMGAARGPLSTRRSQVAADYFEFVLSIAQLSVARDTAKTRQDSLELTARLDGRRRPLSEFVRRSNCLYAATSRDLAAQQNVQQPENALRLLLGRPSARRPHGRRQGADPTAADPPPTSPVELLERRPDVQQAGSRNLWPPTRNIGVARAQFFPQLSLSGGEPPV